MLPSLVTEIPGPRSRELARDLERFESPNVTFLSEDFPIFWERASGANVWDVDGNCFLDLTSAFGVMGLGHRPASVERAMRDQIDLLWHAMGDVHPAAWKAPLCACLSAITFERWGVGEGRSILGNSGFEAVEAALKTAYLRTGRPKVITFSGAYHGLGYGALGAGGMPLFRTPFAEQLKNLGVVLPFPMAKEKVLGEETAAERAQIDQLEDLLYETVHKHEVGAILVESIQGRGGVVVPPAGFLPMLRRVADAEGLVLILDEILTGFNRTGRLFACEHWEVVPDVICLGKGLTSGFPLSACVGRSELMECWPRSEGEAWHTSTFLGNPLGCRMALASIEQHLEVAQSGEVEAIGEDWIESLRILMGENHLSGAVRGAGLMLGLEVLDGAGQPDGDRAWRIVRRALREGVILLADGPQGHVLSLCPSFGISEQESAWALGNLVLWLLEEKSVRQ